MNNTCGSVYRAFVEQYNSNNNTLNLDSIVYCTTLIIDHYCRSIILLFLLPHIQLIFYDLWHVCFMTPSCYSSLLIPYSPSYHVEPHSTLACTTVRR